MAKNLAPCKNTVYMYIFGSLFVLALAVFIYVYYSRNKDTKEHFVEADYDARMHVMKIFDVILNRKPTPEEIDKYASFHNEQDILINILKDFRNDVNSDAKGSTSSKIIEETTESFEEKEKEKDKEKEKKEEDKKEKAEITESLKTKAKDIIAQLNKQFKEKYEDSMEAAKSSSSKTNGNENDKICFKKKDVHEMLNKIQDEINVLKRLVGDV